MKRIFSIGLILSLMMYVSSCGDEFLDVNVDPNNPADAPAENVFPVAVISTAGVVGGNYAILGGLWSQYYTQSNTANQYKTTDAFNLQQSDYQNSWSELYSGALNDYKFTKQKASASGNWDTNFMATVMESYTYQILVDLYDQIPFEEALQGNTGNVSPTYRGGQDVYDSLIVRIDKAMAMPISTSSAQVTPATKANDLLFGGDMNQWLRFANTLKLKIYLRQVYARPQVAEAGIKSLYASGAQFLQTDANVDIFSDETSRSNPLYEQDQRQLNSTQNLKASLTLFSYLQANNDPRLDVYYIPTTTGSAQRAMQQGEFETPTSQLSGATVSRARISPTAPVYFISEAESYFLQAEAVLRGFGTGDVAALYNAGIDASFAQTATTRPAEAYAFPTGGSFEQKLEAIIVQKWVALAGTTQGIEAYFERNRTGFPRTSTVRALNQDRTANANYVAGQFVYPIEGVTNNIFAKRLLFPQTETTRNPNTPTVVPITTPIWWDVD